jgi:predicted metal-dependent phosphotriesterase family hydrolase
MRAETYDLNVVATTGRGTSTTCRNHFDKWVQVSGIAGGATLTIDVTIDGTNWKASGLAGVGSSITADGFYEVPEGAVAIAANRTVQGTGTPAVKLFGRQAHE